MAILVNEKTKVVVQGVTGRQGAFHALRMAEYGTRVVAGTSPGRAGAEVDGIPVYDTVEDAVTKHGANVSALMVPAPFVKDAAFEAIAAGVEMLVIISEHVPVHDAVSIMAYAADSEVRVLGPNTFGVIAPGQCKVGIMPERVYRRGPLGLVSRSGTLSYEIAAALCEDGPGISTAAGIGGDVVVGLGFVDLLRAFEHDEETEVVVLVGEIGGSAEEEAAEFIKTMNKPVVAYIAGQSAPPGKRMGHAGAIVERGRGTYEAKVAALEEGGALIAAFPWEVPELVASCSSE
ncbi:MAG: succinate--CoA ligase subunit alpha [Clostridia bacterium]